MSSSTKPFKLPSERKPQRYPKVKVGGHQQNVDMEGMDPEMKATLQPGDYRKVKKGSSTTAPQGIGGRIKRALKR